MNIETRKTLAKYAAAAAIGAAAAGGAVSTQKEEVKQPDPIIIEVPIPQAPASPAPGSLDARVL